MTRQARRRHCGFSSWSVEHSSWNRLPKRTKLLTTAGLCPDMSPSESRSRLGWLALGTVLAAVVAYVTVSFIGTVILGLFVYYSTRPIYDRVRERLPGDTVAAAVSLFLLALPALALVGYTGVVAYREARLVAGIQLPKLNNALFGAVVDPEVLYQRGLEEYLSTDQLQVIMDAFVSAADTLIAVGVILIQAFVVLALAFYLLRDGRKLSDWFVTSFGDDQEVLPEFLRAVDQSLESVFFGNILNALVTGALGALLFSLLNIVAPAGTEIPAAALTGLLTGVASLIPVVGMKLVYVPLSVYIGAQSVIGAGVESLWFVAVFFAVAFVFVDTIPDLVLRPYVSGRNLHVGTLMLAYTLGPLLFGWYGLFLMPVLLIFVFHFARIVLPELVAGQRVRPEVFANPAAVPPDSSGKSVSGPEDTTGSGAPATGENKSDSQFSWSEGPSGTTDGGRAEAESDDRPDSAGSEETSAESDSSVSSGDSRDRADGDTNEDSDDG